MTDLRQRISEVLVEHLGGWIDNGNPDRCRCRCGYRPGLGEAHYYHTADAVLAALQPDIGAIAEAIDFVISGSIPGASDGFIAANRAVMDYIDGDPRRELIGCTPAMVAAIAVNAYIKAQAIR